MTRLRDLGEWSGGNTPSKANTAYWTNGTIPWVSPKDMKVDEITSSEDRVSEAALKEGRVSLLPEGSVLVVTRSGILSHTFPVAVTKIPVTINQDLKALAPKPGVLPTYVAHALRGASRRILKECSKHGTTVASVETNALLDFEIPIVDLDEQRLIVAELEKQFSRLDEAVADLKRVKAHLRHYIAATLRTAFTGELVAREEELARLQGRTFERGNELLARVVSAQDGRKRKAAGPSRTSIGKPAIEGWAWTTVGECFNVAVGATPSRKEPDYWGGPVPWVSSGEVQFSRIANTHESITEAGLANSSTQINPVGSVLLGMIGQGRTRGQAAILEIPAANNQNCAAIWVSQTPVPPEFVYYWLMSRYEQTRGEGSGNNQQALNKKLVEAIPLPMPPLSEQYRIVAEVDRRLSIVHEIDSEVDASLKRTEALRSAVLARAWGLQ